MQWLLKDDGHLDFLGKNSEGITLNGFQNFGMLESSKLMAILGGGGLSIHEISIESDLQCDIFAEFCRRTGSLVGLGLAWESRSCPYGFWCVSKNSRGRKNNDHRCLLWWCLTGLLYTSKKLPWNPKIDWWFVDVSFFSKDDPTLHGCWWQRSQMSLGHPQVNLRMKD